MKVPGIFQVVGVTWQAADRSPACRGSLHDDRSLPSGPEDRDAFLDRGLAKEAAALCDDVRLVHLEQASHWVQHEEAETVNRLLADFLQDVLDGKAIHRNRVRP